MDMESSTQTTQTTQTQDNPKIPIDATDGSSTTTEGSGVSPDYSQPEESSENPKTEGTSDETSTEKSSGAIIYDALFIFHALFSTLLTMLINYRRTIIK